MFIFMLKIEDKVYKKRQNNELLSKSLKSHKSEKSSKSSLSKSERQLQVSSKNQSRSSSLLHSKSEPPSFKSKKLQIDLVDESVKSSKQAADYQVC